MTTWTRVGWCGFAISVAVLGLILAWASHTMHPLRHGDPKDFWAVVWAVTTPGEDPEEEIGGRAYTWYAPYFYYSQRGGGIPLHGVRLKEVDEKELMDVFPGIIDSIVASPSNRLTLAQITALLGKQPTSASEGLAQLSQRRAQIASSPERMRAFLHASYVARWRDRAARRPDLTDVAISQEREVSAYIQRAQCYWANIFIEAVLLCGILCLLWFPLISTRLRRFMPVFWGSIPFLILTPYFLGYCEIGFTSLSPWHGGGALYPWVLRIGCRSFTPLTPKWDVALLNALPHPLSVFTQWPLDILAMSGGGVVGPTVPGVMGLAIAAVLWAAPRVSRCAFRSKGDEGAQPSVGGDAEDRAPQP